jgi:hypothetical protein
MHRSPPPAYEDLQHPPMRATQQTPVQTGGQGLPGVTRVKG